MYCLLGVKFIEENIISNPISLQIGQFPVKVNFHQIASGHFHGFSSFNAVSSKYMKYSVLYLSGKLKFYVKF